MNLKLIEFEINDLYGLYNHKLTLNNSENISIIHGPNGVGKTALLKSINYVFSCEFNALSKIPFSHINAKLSDNTEIHITRVGISVEQLLRRTKESSHKIEVEITKNKKGIASHLFFDDVSRGFSIPPWFVRVGADVWLDERTGREITREMLETYIRPNIKSKEKKSIETITETLKSISVHFVETNRLYKQPQTLENWKNKSEPQIISSVRDCAKQLVSHIGTALKDYGKKSQELDQSFPHRFISERQTPMALDDLKNRLNDLSTQLTKLRLIGLLDADGIQPFDTESLDTAEASKLEIMNLYVRDSEEKLAVFDSLSSRAQLLLEGLNRKFNNKRIDLSKEKGLTATGPKNLDIDLDALSSGEQHEIVLLYELLFKVPENSLVLIDEPELSLHVTWQKAFLPELISVAKEVGFHSVLATHSPYIVGDRYDLMIALDSDSENDSLE